MGTTFINRLGRVCLLAAFIGYVTACGVAGTGSSTPSEPRFAGLGAHHRVVDTDSPEAQSFFDQGLAFLYAFNHDEAIRSFQRAAELDPGCAMARWGIAYGNGPHINNPAVPPHREAAAFAAASEALRLAASLEDGPDRALIEAVAVRYASPQPADRAPLDQAFADAMAAAYGRFRDDGDVGALYAESLMDLHPWDLWTQAGEPKEWTPQIVGVVEEVLARHPRHPLALHLYIHAVEASDDPGRADTAADTLRDLTPGLGHLVHMPSHIDVRRGRWEQAIEANTRAIEADRAYRELAPAPPDFYRLYISHNRHMKAYAAMMIGRSEIALTTIRDMVADIPEDWLRANASWADGFIAMPYEVMLRFGRWQEILAEPEPPSSIPLTRSLHFAARAVALAALGRPEEARAEQRAFLAARTAVAEDATFGNNRAHDILNVADRLVEGEILYREGRKGEGIAALYEATAREDQLRYDEPPDWIQPVRHALGATLLMEGRHADAEAVYREDLVRLPGNGWSLYGLGRALRLQGRTAEAEQIEAQFAKAWEGADTTLRSSCFCQPGV